MNFVCWVWIALVCSDIVDKILYFFSNNKRLIYGHLKLQ